MHASAAPPGGGAAGAPPNAEPPAIGAAPLVGKALGRPIEAVGAAPVTGGNTESLCWTPWLGSGAGNVPCAKAWPAPKMAPRVVAPRVMTTAVSGTIRRRMIKGVSPARPQRLPNEARFAM